MGKVKRQTKQWRKLDTQDVDEFLEKSTREERQGLAVEGIPDADLFFVDKAPDDGTAAPEIKLPKKIQARQRITRAQAILAGAHKALPVAIPMKKIKKTSAATAATKKSAASKGKEQAIVPAKTQLKKKDEGAIDLWSHGGEASADGDGGALVPAKKRRQADTSHAAPAVEIDAPGCSFNPDRELHQDAVAEAVAAEMRKVYDRDLEPTAPLAVVDYDPETDELDMLQVDAEEDESDAESSDEEEREEDGKKGGQRKKTKKDRNREVRRRGEEAELAKRRKDKKQRQDLSELKKIRAEVEDTLTEREERLARRKADLAEKAANEPARLGKQKFEPMPLQVLTTEEIQEGSGSLRKLKPTAMLAKERFKSLQRRGIIEPRRKQMKSGKKKIEFIRGERADKAQERQAEVDEVRTEVKKLKDNAKKAKKAKF